MHLVIVLFLVFYLSVCSNSAIFSILGAANTSAIHTHLEQFADQGFHYGRSWLSNQVGVVCIIIKHMVAVPM